MPANTSRGYPYSIPSDPADVPAATEALARAVDLDVQARDASIHQRAAFRYSSITPVSFYPGIPFVQNRALPFDYEDLNVGGAVVPFGSQIVQITPQLPGFWWFQASMTFPRSGATFMDTIGITLQTETSVLARNSTHVAPPVSDAGNNISVSAGTYMNGTTDFVQLLGMAHAITPAPGNPLMTVRRRYILGYRMTES